MLKTLTHFFVLVTILTGLFALHPATTARAFNILTVDNLTDDNDGSCTDGDCSLREAISSAADGDSINVVITGTIVLTDTLTIDKSITINGPGTSQLTLDGDNKYRIFNLPNDSPTNTIHISDMTMTKGYADPTVVCGGGAINSYAFLTLDHVVITDNHAPADLGNCFYPRGGGILFFNGYGSLTLTNSTVSNNSTYYGGGGIYFNSSNGNISLNNVTVDNNRSDAADGGGIYVYNSLATATITNSIISNNDANGSSADGGGLYLDDHSGSPITAVIENTNFQLNTAGGNGGGIFTYRPITTILDSTFNTNSASGDGGGLFNFTGNVTINSSTFNGNSATSGSTSDGGAIYNLGNSNGGSITIVNSTMNGNSALGDGGAIYNQASGGTVNDIATMNIYNSTIVSNNAVGNYGGGGIFASTAGGSEVSTVSLFNSILYANTLTSGTGGENCRIINSATIALNNHNLLQNLASDCNPGASDVTSNLARPSIVLGLTNNGGATQTMALPNGSPAIDAGDPAICAAAPVNNVSQNDYTRSLGGNCDIGAYELDNILPSITSITRASTNPTTASSVDFTVTFSEDVTGVSTSAPFEDFELDTSGVTGASITDVSGSGSVYTVSVSTGTGGGTLRLDIPASATITDLGGNALSGLPYSSGETYNVFGFQVMSQWTSDMTYVTGGWDVKYHPRTVGDVNNDGREDLIGFGNTAVWVALSNGTSFAPMTQWTSDMTYMTGGWDVNYHPRMVGDVNNDGRDDLIGFGNTAVWVALSNGTSFAPMTQWTSDMTYMTGGWDVKYHPRMVGDVNNDGREDLIGFGNTAVWVALSNGTSFAPMTQWTSDMTYMTGGWDVNYHPRMVGDVNNDGRDDLIGFGNTAVWVALSNGSNGFAPMTQWTSDMTYMTGGWDVNYHPRTVGDVNNDGRDDLIGFGNTAVWVALSNGSNGFAPMTQWTSDMTYMTGGWDVNYHPRTVGDVNNDGKVDLVGFGNTAVWVARAK